MTNYKEIFWHWLLGWIIIIASPFIFIYAQLLLPIWEVIQAIYYLYFDRPSVNFCKKWVNTVNPNTRIFISKLSLIIQIKLVKKYINKYDTGRME